MSSSRSRFWFLGIKVVSEVRERGFKSRYLVGICSSPPFDAVHVKKYYKTLLSKAIAWLKLSNFDKEKLFLDNFSNKLNAVK